MAILLVGGVHVGVLLTVITAVFKKVVVTFYFFLLFDAFRRLNVAEKKWVNPTHLMYLFLRSYSLYAFTIFL